MIKPKNTSYRKKYKPDNWMYIVIIVLFTVIRCIPISCGSPNLDDAFNDLAVGAIASTVVAWLIDIANCNKKNLELQEKECMVFAEYCSDVNDLRYFIASRCRSFSQSTDLFTFDRWLMMMTDISNYDSKSSPVVIIERSYFHVLSYVRKIRSTLISLRQQYCMLIESDIIDTDDFRQHVSLQLRICDEICDTLELYKYDTTAVTENINEKLISLTENVRVFFPDAILQTFSWDSKG